MPGFFGYIGPPELASELAVDAVTAILRGSAPDGVAFSTTHERRSGFLCTFLECRSGSTGEAARADDVAMLVGFDGPDRGAADALLAADAFDAGRELAAIRGGFALAIWSAKRGRLLLARDRAGLRPLYVAGAGVGLLFSTELRAILASGLVPRRISWAGLAGYLHFGAVPDSLTIVDGVQPVPRGSAILWSARGGEARVRPFAEDEAGADERVRRSVAAHVKPGRAVAMLDLACTGPCPELSGIAGEAGASSIVNLSLDDSRGVPEGSVESRVLSLSPEDGEDVVHGVLDAFDQPVADGVSSWLLSREAAANGATVALASVGRATMLAEPPGSSWAFNDYMQRLVRRVRRGARPVFSRTAIDRLVGPLPDTTTATASSLLDEYAAGSAVAPWWAALPQMTRAHGLGFCAPRAEAGATGGEAPKIEPLPRRVPMRDWLAGPVSGEARDHLFALSRDGILTGEPLRALWRRFRQDPDPALTREVWALVVLGAWLARHEVRA